MKKLRRILTSLLFLTILSLGGWYLFKTNVLPSYHYDDFGVGIPEGSSYLGIDVSHYQGEINWKEVGEMVKGKDSISFAFIKATEGLSLKDKYFEKNANGAHENGIAFGFYHFLIPSKSAKKQAKFFCEAIRTYPYNLRPVVDIETETNSKAALRDSVIVFMRTVKVELGVYPVIYTFQDYFENYFLPEQNFHDEFFWLARYYGDCEYYDRSNVVAWQFSDKGKVDGIKGDVDLNVAKTNFFQLIGLVR